MLDVDSSTAVCYGEVVAALYKKGKPLPINDVWIADTALQHDLTLITRDKHFNEIEYPGRISPTIGRVLVGACEILNYVKINSRN